MAGKSALLLCMLFCAGKFCHATLNTPTSSITPQIAVGADVTITIDVTASSNATDVRVSLGGTLFETVVIRPSSVTYTDAGSSSYDSRVDVTHEVITANTNVRVKVTFTSIQKADDSLAIKFEDTSDVETATFTLDVEYCNNAIFGSVATSPSTTCGVGCIEQFTCASDNNTFPAACGENAIWNVTDAPCLEYCNNTIFGDSATYSSSTTCAVGCTAQFTCASDSSTFPALCQDNAIWNVTDAPCRASCNASNITHTTDDGNTTVVHGDSKEFTCGRHRPIARPFNRTCSDGQWSNETNPCSSEINQRDAVVFMKAILNVTLIIGMAVVIAVIMNPPSSVHEPSVEKSLPGPPAWLIAIYVISSCLAPPGWIIIAATSAYEVTIVGIVLAIIGNVGLIVTIALYMNILKKVDPPAWIIAFYVISSCLSISGIIMIAVGFTDLVAIVGLVFTNIGEVVLIVVIAAYVGVVKGYFKIPNIPVIVSGTSFTPSWEPSAGATPYELKISIGSDPILNIPNAKSGKKISDDVIKPGLTYTLSVVAISGNTRNVVGKGTFTTDGGEPIDGRRDGNVARNERM